MLNHKLPRINMTVQLWILWDNVWQQRKCRKRYLNLNDANKRQLSISNISVTAYFVYSHTFSCKSPTHHTESGLPVVKWVNELLSGLSLCPLQRAKLIVVIITGFANFIDEWSHCDFCFTNFGVILEYLESSTTTKKAIFRLSSTRSWHVYTIVRDTQSSCGGPLTCKAQIHDGGFDRNLPSSCFVVLYNSLMLML